uniref:Uncharacterized protein n=1 Tax=Parascaris equorum TaxID=6256 RepID=A0A914S4W9_PAREQ
MKRVSTKLTRRKRILLVDQIETKPYPASRPDERAVTEQLNVESAATGDNLEVVKFMVAIMNEMRITHAGLFDPQYGLSPSVFQHLKEIFRYLDEQSKWDTIDSWPAILSQGLAEESY